MSFLDSQLDEWEAWDQLPASVRIIADAGPVPRDGVKLLALYRQWGEAELCAMLEKHNLELFAKMQAERFRLQ